MPDALSRRVDPWRAAQARQRVSGTLDAARLPRLAAVAEPVGLLEVSLDFEKPPGIGHSSGGHSSGRPHAPQGAGTGTKTGESVHVTIRVTGRLSSTCQRCLEEVEFPADLDARVTIVADDSSDGEADPVVVAPGDLLDAGSLVEDELLLALPFAPTHADGECVAQLPVADAPEVEPAQDERPRRTDNPFAVLGTLKGRDRDDN